MHGFYEDDYLQNCSPRGGDKGKGEVELINANTFVHEHQNNPNIC